MKRQSTIAVSVLLAFALAGSTLAGCSSTTTADSTTPATSAAPAGMPAGGPPAGGAPGAGGGAADTSSVKTKYLDLAYANQSDAQKLDIYLPNEGTGPFPVIISVHGGAFMMGDKADGQLTPMLAGLDRGYAVVGVNYRLSGESVAPAAINDVKAAVRYVRANAEKYNLDPDRIAAWGGSAGGNLVSLAGTSGGVKALSDPALGNSEVSDEIQAVVDWFGPIDFGAMDEQFTASGTGPANHDAADSPESKYLGAALNTVPAKVKEADPTTYITADDPPFLIQHGTNDANVPVEQSKDFSAALIKTLGAEQVTLRLLDGASHADAAFTTDENVKLVLDWLDANLK